LALGQTCALDADCDSDHCALSVSGGSICCDGACNDTCERCGETGACDAFPATHPDCPVKTCAAKTTCLEERTPAPHECSGHGECAECEPILTRADIPCGVGEQCDGSGACETTGIGRVAAGLRHTCAIRANGNVVCWGDNTRGQLGAAFDRAHVGDDETVADLVPDLELNFERQVVALTAGFAHTCALFDDGGVRCWGLGDDNLLLVSVGALLGTNSVRYTRVGSVDFVDPLYSMGNVQLPRPAVQISAATGGAHTCAVLDSGAVACWGFNSDGQCGDGTQAERGVQGLAVLPVVDLGGELALEVKAAPGHTCVLLEGGAVTCFGEGNFGRLGYASNADRLAPRVPPEQNVAHVAIGGPARHIATGLGHTCALLDGGKVRCWGHNNQGQLGYGHNWNIGDDETPADAATLDGPGDRTFLGGDVPIGGVVLALSQVVDSGATCALLDGGAVRCWGENNDGQLGYGHTQTLGTTFTPTELEGEPAGVRYPAGGDVDFGALALALADGGRCALMMDGLILYCWGDNEDGELGLPNRFPDGSKTLTPREMGPVLWEPSTLSSKAP
jgi:alpha-tubulin suppressor-like RCC1 family protein